MIYGYAVLTNSPTKPADLMTIDVRCRIVYVVSTHASITAK